LLEPRHVINKQYMNGMTIRQCNATLLPDGDSGPWHLRHCRLALTASTLAAIMILFINDVVAGKFRDLQ
jgi:hypothetical protein